MTYIFFSPVKRVLTNLNFFGSKTRSQSSSSSSSSSTNNEMMSPEEIMSQASNGYSPHDGRRRRRRIMWCTMILVALTLVIGLSVGLTRGESKEKKALRQEIKAALLREKVDGSSLDSDSTPMGQALDWLVRDDTQAMDRSIMLQRFALATFYFSTYQVTTIYTPDPPAWTSSTNWLRGLKDGVTECQWKGVQCTDRGRVNGISLESNQLTGRIPQAMVLLKDHLVSIDLTTNLIYMTEADFGFLRSLKLLKTLLMDDNYISTIDGIPSQLGTCTDLEKLRLSYNLLGGQLDNNVFKSLSKLTHLEIESNFISGTMPASIGNMENLIYLYMRRNSMSFNLNFMKTGKMKNLFACWLDANSIVGTLPTQLGLLTGLASLSVTNGTLTGTIPTEFGNLSALRRLWLYSNELKGTVPAQMANLTNLEVFEIQRNAITGTMPAKICSTVRASEYVHKSLTADCTEIECTGCCTHCHDIPGTTRFR